MGGNLAHNVARFENIHVTNRSYDKVVRVVNNNPPSNNNIKGHRNVEDMVIAMERPRTVMTVLPSGKRRTTLSQSCGTRWTKETLS